MAFQQPLAPELEKQAHELVARLRQQTDEELLALARLLVSKEDQDLFGDTEFEVRDIVHRIGAKAFQTHLAEKKRLRRFGRRLPPLSAQRQVPRLPRQKSPEHLGAGGVRACLLLLRALRQGRIALG